MWVRGLNEGNDMAFVKYIGLKKNFGPLKKKWMNESVFFDEDGISDNMDEEIVDAILLSMPQLFIRSGPPKQKSAPEIDKEVTPKKKAPASLKLKVKPKTKKRKKKKVGTKLTDKHIK